MSRPRRWRLLGVLGFVALALHGCDWDLDGLASDVFVAVIGDEIPTAPENTARVVKRIVQRANRIVVRRGTVELSGDFVLFPTFAPQPVPSMVRLIVRRESGPGVVLESVFFDVAVQPDGHIAHQSFTVPPMVVASGQQVALAIQPLDAALPVGTLSLRVRYRQS